MSDIIINDRMPINRWAYLSAYALAVKHGFVGTESDWLASLKGETGEQGDPGVSLAYKGAYAAATEYAYNDSVTYDGDLYLHVGEESTTGTAPTDTDVWAMIFSASDAADDIAAAVTEAQGYASASETAAENAELWATGDTSGTPGDENNAKYYAEQAMQAKIDAVAAQRLAEDAVTDAEDAQDAAEDAQTAAAASAAAAAGSAAAAAGSATDAATYAYNAEVKAGEALAAASGAITAKIAAETAATNAGNSATAASNSVGAAAGYAEDSQAWATGYRGSTPISSGDQYHNNAKYWADEAAGSATDAATAQGNAETAQGLAEAAQTAAETAQGKAEDAQEAAEAAAASIDPDELNKRILASYPHAVVSGSVASFSDGADNIPVRSLTAQITPAQEGSGDPSPTNVRPISGWTEANIVVSPTMDEQDGTTYTIAFPDSAGTVYGGTLTDNGNGTWTLTVTHGISAFSGGDWALSASGGNEFFQRSANVPTALYNTAICNQYKAKVPSASNLDDYSFGFLSNGQYLRIKDTRYATAADFKEHLQADGIQIYYPLATPLTYTLTADSVKTLLGTNNIFSDTGDVEVDYHADPTLFVEQALRRVNPMLAYAEGGYTATRNYTAGEYVAIGNAYYKLTANVASGAALDIGTNITATTVGAELTALAE